MRAESRLESGTLVVLSPMWLGHQQGRKRILAPDASELTPSTRLPPNGVLVKALARARRWQKLLDKGDRRGGETRIPQMPQLVADPLR